MDSIIRMSRHKNGPEKDVYAPRFQKNIQQTFNHLAKSSMPRQQKEKTKKVIRYWRSGNIYPGQITDTLDKIIDHAIGQDTTNPTQVLYFKTKHSLNSVLFLPFCTYLRDTDKISI